MNYYRGEECVGMEIELSALFCEACGYGLNVMTMEFGSDMLAAVASGKVDFACGGIAYTPERAESVLFPDPYYTGGMMMAVLKAEETASTGEGGSSFLDGVKSSFYKTFIRENRWQLFVKGVVNTLVIALLSQPPYLLPNHSPPGAAPRAARLPGRDRGPDQGDGRRGLHRGAGPDQDGGHRQKPDL